MTERRFRLHLISGLPRSGSTLLAALLRQNPRCTAGMTSPLASLGNALMQNMAASAEFGSFFDDERRARVLRAVTSAYYADAPEGSIVFDTNRVWTARTALLDILYPDARIICCVRDVAWILDSIERLARRNALQPSKMFNTKVVGSIYSRVEALMDSEHGLVGRAWASLREAWFGESARRLIVVPYDSLVQHPAQTMARLYEELGERSFTHDYDHVAYDAPDYDADLSLPGLHRVRPRVEHIERRSCLPPDIVAKYAEVNFWKNSKLNINSTVIL